MNSGPENIRRLKKRISKGKRSISSRRWLERQINDPFSIAASEGIYRSRSAYKLIELNNKFKLFIITNQGDISKGRLTIEQFYKFNNYLLRQLENEGGHIEDTFVCPHRPKDHCICRKPKSGMLEAAEQKYGLNLKGSYVIGDRKTDIQIGKNVGSKTIFVLTGKDSPNKTMNPDFIAKDLLDAAKYILSN